MAKRMTGLGAIAGLSLGVTVLNAAAQAPTLTQVYGPASVPPGCRAGPVPYCRGPYLPVPDALFPAPLAPAAPALAYSEPPPAPPPPPAPAPPLARPIGWVYGPYTSCADPPRCSIGAVTVAADGLNVRAAPNGPPVMALTNGVPLIPLGREGNWLLVAAACDLTPTFAWSWTAGVPLNRCWVY
jgi:hypothetical protein